MKTKLVRGMDIQLVHKSGYSPETPEHIPKLHSLMILNGRRNAGKTTAISNYLHILKQNKLVDEIFVTTPSYESNKKNWEALGIPRENFFEPTKDGVEVIKALIKKQSNDWDSFMENKAKWDKIVNSDMPFHMMPPAYTKMLVENGALEPQWKYEIERPPILFWVLDDCLGWDIYKPSAGLTKFVQSHRHHYKIGISVAMLVQTYSCSSGNAGVARPIRENSTLLCLWKMKDQNQLKKIHEEIGNDVSLEKFDQMLEYATSKPFGFLMIDFCPKKPEYGFRANFNEYLLS
jgi:hypothetical protein